MITWGFSIHLPLSPENIKTSFTYFKAAGNRIQTGLVFCALLFSCLCSFSQKDLVQQGDNLVNDKKYKEAAIIYKKAHDKDKKNKQIVLKLADVNYLNENYPLAQTYYAEYFSDSVYQNVPQFLNYAKTAKINGNIKLATRLYYKIFEGSQDATAKTNYELYKLYLDTVQKIRAYNLDSNYSCITLDASESVDPLAMPMNYLWMFEDSTTTEGITFEHCFKEGGLHKITLSIRDKQTGLIRANDTTLTVYTEDSPVKFTAPRTGRRYLPIDLDAAPTVFYNYEIIEYLWDMDDGNIASGKKIKYRYQNFGTYNVRLTVITKDKTNGKTELFSAIKKVEVNENYVPNGKSFIDQRNEAK